MPRCSLTCYPCRVTNAEQESTAELEASNVFAVCRTDLKTGQEAGALVPYPPPDCWSQAAQKNEAEDRAERQGPEGLTPSPCTLWATQSHGRDCAGL